VDRHIHALGEGLSEGTAACSSFGFVEHCLLRDMNDVCVPSGRAVLTERVQNAKPVRFSGMAVLSKDKAGPAHWQGSDPVSSKGRAGDAHGATAARGGLFLACCVAWEHPQKNGSLCAQAAYNLDGPHNAQNTAESDEHRAATA
jgi:hypothetical protein